MRRWFRRQEEAEAAPAEPPVREWNLWELEDIRPERDEELGLLLVFLRQFANADGVLPESFDPLVRESFGGLLAHAA